MRIHRLLRTTLPLAIAFTAALLVVHSSKESPSPAGGLTGKVTFSGKAPENQSWTIGKNRAVCGGAKTLDRIIVDKNGGVANAFIIVKNVRGSVGGMKAPKIEQKACRYLPHAQVAGTGSSLEVSNDDDLLHNVHGYYLGAEHTTAFNFAQPIQNQKTQIKLAKTGIIELQCDAGHTWMTSLIYVTDNPYVAVSGADGSFSIPNLAPGTYTVQCWHEGWKVVNERDGRPNFAEPKVSEQSVTVSGGSPAQVQFQLSE